MHEHDVTYPNARARRSSCAPRRATLMLLAIAACNGGGSDSGHDTDGAAGEIAFHGEQTFLPGLDIDTGWLPDGSPVAVRTTVSATGAVTIDAHATTDGEQLMPVAGSGSLAVEGALALEVSARIDTMGFSYEGVVDSFDYAIAAAQTDFDPFALDTPVTVSAMLPAAELGSVPIPAVPGATLVVEVTGGELTTTFEASCADARDGFGQYAGTLTMAGTVACAATIEIAIPLGDPLSFGPFAFDLPIPPIATPTDLGTRSLATGDAADAMGICAAPTTSTDDGASTGADESGSDSIGDATSPASSGPDTDATSDAPGTSDDDGDASSDDGTDPSADDPDYPLPTDDACPAGDVAVGIGADPPNVVCLPPCGGDGGCPSGASGSAVGSCAYNPDSSYLSCTFDDECNAGETCIDSSCSLPPSHCALLCDDAHACPDTMTCLSGVCAYLL